MNRRRSAIAMALLGALLGAACGSSSSKPSRGEHDLDDTVERGAANLFG